MPDNSNSAYETKDLGEAAALITENIALVHIRRDGHVCWFVFSDNVQRIKLTKSYYFGDLPVNARAYNESLSRLKNMIFNS
jgi:hypothetical protein